MWKLIITREKQSWLSCDFRRAVLLVKSQIVLKFPQRILGKKLYFISSLRHVTHIRPTCTKPARTRKEIVGNLISLTPDSTFLRSFVQILNWGLVNLLGESRVSKQRRKERKRHGDPGVFKSKGSDGEGTGETWNREASILQDHEVRGRSYQTRIVVAGIQMPALCLPVSTPGIALSRMVTAAATSTRAFFRVYYAHRECVQCRLHKSR